MGEFVSVSDDKEPKNTAGRPVLEVVKGSDLTNIIVCVVRYFGGTLLGTGGLVKAYTEAAQLVVNNIESEQLVETQTFTFSIPYEHYDKVNMFLKEYQREMESTFLSDITITYTCEQSVYEMIKETLVNITKWDNQFLSKCSINLIAIEIVCSTAISSIFSTISSGV